MAKADEIPPAVEDRLRRFDQATQRQREREQRQSQSEASIADRGWSRDSLYDRPDGAGPTRA
jgi:hypothetical protein